MAIAAAASPYGLDLRDDSHATPHSRGGFTRYRPLTDNPVLRRPLESGQYTSLAFSQALATRHRASMGSVGDSYDNAVAESFFDSFKTELIADRVWKTRTQLELAVVEYLGWFNHTRLHERLGDLPPAEFEEKALSTMTDHRPATPAHID